MPILKFYKAKRPTLQLDLLNSLAFGGRMSKKGLAQELNANYSDVSDAVKSLNEKGLTERTGSLLFPMGRRPEIFYRLTKLGLEAFLSEDHKPEEFWAAVISFCKHHRRVLMNEFDRYYNLYIDKYIGQDIYSEYSFYSNFYFFDNIFKQYWEDNKEKSFIIEDGVPVSQKILEYLSFNPKSTKKEIASATNVPLREVIRFLQEHSLDSYNSMEFLRASRDPEAILERYRELLDHSLIVSISSAHDQEGRYSLSLFGIMLILGVIRTEYSLRFFNREKKRTNFYSVKLEVFFEKLAKNYHKKLPLIFGKWTEIKEKLVMNSEDLIPFLFDPLFYKQERSTYFSLPITEGGNKEIYDGVKAISIRTSRKLLEIYQAGMKALVSLDEHNWLVSAISDILDEIEIRLGYSDIKLSLRKLIARVPTSSDKILDDYFEAIEGMFAKEITFIFYVSLIRNVSYDYKWTHERELLLPYTDERDFLSAKSMLMELLKYDHDIKSLVCRWIKDATEYQSLVNEQLQTLNKELDIT